MPTLPTDSPKWVVKSKEHLENIIPKIEAIMKEGQAEIERGLEKENKAKYLLIEAKYLERILNQSHKSETWHDEIVGIEGGLMATGLESLDFSMDELLRFVTSGGAISAGFHDQFTNAMPSTDSVAGSAIYTGARYERRLAAIESGYTVILNDDDPKRLTSRDDLFKELKNTLQPFGDKYVTMLEGSESALHTDTPDSLSQSAHSIRDCFQQLLEELAPSKVVESQPWFKPTEGAPGGISRRSRFRYMLYRSGENVDQGTIQRLDVAIEMAKVSLDLCMARAHDHDPTLSKDEVRLAVDQARDSLLHVLELYNLRRSVSGQPE